ncbi:MAG: SGNH/GDSL hydrolase family protein [Pyrinomonadaceae bacterium]
MNVARVFGKFDNALPQPVIVQQTVIPKKKQRLFAAITIIGGLVLGLFVFEIALRVVGYSAPKFYAADEVLGHGLIPGISGIFRKEGRSFVEINKDGFRDVDHSIEKPPNTFRIAVVGDSFVEAMQVEREEILTNFMPGILQDCGAVRDKQIEMFAFGVAGFSTAQEWLLFRHKVSKYHPDLVVLVITTSNDILNNVPFVDNEPRPYFFLRDGELVLDERFKSSPEYVFADSALNRTWMEIYNRVRVFQAIGQGHRELILRYKAWKERTREQEQQRENTAAAKPAKSEIGIDHRVYLTPDDPKWEEAWAVTEKVLLEFRDDVQNAGADFLVVTGSNGVQVLPDPRERLGFMKQIDVTDLLYPERRLESFTQANAINFFALAPYLQEYAETNKVFLHGFDNNIGYGHWNQLGHQTAGETIAQKICEGAIR